MASRVKEDEKNERIIRGLLKHPDNKRCINCNSLGPQYVCINFWTFVCTTCSGIHREFTHRVKSISMAKFTPQEVTALQEGGNQRAKQVYLKDWDPQRQSLPNSSNVERLRDFIKHVYVDKRYAGERSYDKPPRVKTGDKEDSYENRRADAYQGGSRSPPYEDTYERRYSGRSSPGGRSDDRNSRHGYDERRSPGYEQEGRQYGDYRRTSPARAEVINDWRRDDRFGNDRKFGDRRMSDGGLKPEGRSPDRMKDPESSSPPIVRPVREILGENVLPLRVSEPPKANGGRTVDGLAHTQRTASSSSLGSTIENPVVAKVENTVSLIDFDADPAPQPAAAVTQAQQANTSQTATQPASTNDNNWASFDLAPAANKPSQAPTNLNTLDSVISQLSVPASVPGQPSGAHSAVGAPTTASVANANLLSFGGNSPVASVGHTQISPFSTSGPAAPQMNSFATFPSANNSAAAPGAIPEWPNSGGNSFSMQHQQPSLFQNPGSQSTTPQFTPAFDGASGNKPWNSSLLQNVQGSLSTGTAQAPQPVPVPAQGVTSSSALQPTNVEAKPSGRKELPQDLFAPTYPSYLTSAPGWRTGPPHGMGFGMPYNTAMPMPSFQQSQSTNPFDLNNESPQVRAQTFPSMASLQGALPNVAPPSNLMHSLPSWMPSQSSPYPSAMPSQAPTYAPAMPTISGAYTGPQVPGNMPPHGHQGMGGFGSERAAHGFMNAGQQMGGRFPAPANSHPYSSGGGNPFG